MTDKLREARIAEAKRRTEIDRKGSVSWSRKDTFANHLASLYEQDWRPEPEVDAVEAAFKAWDQAAPSDVGFLDAFRAGHAHAQRARERLRGALRACIDRIEKPNLSPDANYVVERARQALEATDDQ